NHKAYGNRGNLNDLRGDLQQALDDYNRALALAPDYETVYGNRAGTLLKLKRFNEALSDINIAIAATPQNPALYAIRADIYVGLNRYAEAFHDANTAQQLGKPVNPDFIRMLQQRVAAPPR
ncbi:MAG TPA: tetratricopeptide repeat protein, partial [Chitinophagales bacterium]|nr:tetratricopeptide repeat protein [Chitinophagales bacterium]